MVYILIGYPRPNTNSTATRCSHSWYSGLLIGALVELPTYVVGMVLVETPLGRRHTQGFLLGMSALLCAVAAIPSLQGAGQMAVVEGSRGFATAS